MAYGGHPDDLLRYPWIRWDRGAHLPDQAVLVDLGNRRFFFFWIEIWPQEFYYVAGLLIMAGLGLFLFISVLGRVWCGYACPQTVWVDLFQHIDRFFDGDRNAQFRLLRAPLTYRKIFLRLSKYWLWLMISLATGGGAEAPFRLSRRGAAADGAGAVGCMASCTLPGVAPRHQIASR